MRRRARAASPLGATTCCSSRFPCSSYCESSPKPSRDGTATAAACGPAASLLLQDQVPALSPRKAATRRAARPDNASDRRARIFGSAARDGARILSDDKEVARRRGFRSSQVVLRASVGYSVLPGGHV